MKKIINIVMSGFLTIIMFIVMCFFVGFIQWSISEFVVLKFIFLSLWAIVVLLFMGVVWLGIYDYIKERWSIKNL